MRLRVPPGWAVSDNKFYDTDPEYDEEGLITNWHEGFMEDVLWIQEIRYSDGRYQAPDTGCFHIDLSWRSGTYIAKLLHVTKTEDQPDVVFESTDRFEIRDKIEFWLESCRNKK